MILLSENAFAFPANNCDAGKVSNLAANFYIIPDSTKTLTLNFVDQSSGSPTSWFWDFGDKSTSTNQNPIHTYGIAKKWTVTLKIKNAMGSNTTTKIIEFQ